jgi:DNA mismatch repair ATPase MutS
MDSRRNELFVAISVLVLFVPLVAMAIEAWRLRCGPSIPRWLAALGELEALSAIAGYAYEHPADPFPELADGGPLYEGESLGHPLIADRRCVRNDATLGSGTSVLVVSGSNMSGKSTYLRTVGANAVLAMMGAPVRAKRLRLSPLSVGASIRRTDSLQDGTSHFYAEIKRIRQLVDLAQGPRPALFLVDEILHGTNSHDRTIGSAAIVKGFIGRGAIGLVTTHDLSLAKVADELAPKAVNVHFEDQLVDGRMVFDYKLRPGVVTKSNALELMRSLGLDV